MNSTYLISEGYFFGLADVGGSKEDGRGVRFYWIQGISTQHSAFSDKDFDRIGDRSIRYELSVGVQNSGDVSKRGPILSRDFNLAGVPAGTSLLLSMNEMPNLVIRTEQGRYSIV